MDRLKNIRTLLVGDIDIISSERLFITATSLVGSVFLFILCMVHLIMGMKVAPVIYAGVSSLTMLFLYYFVRVGKCLFIPKLILSTAGLILLDLTWYSKFLSNGPVLFFILIFGALIIWVWEGKYLVMLLSMYFLNFLALYLIEKNAPVTVLEYNIPGKRLLDIYLSMALYSILLISLLHIVKKEFIRQKKIAQKSDKMKSAFLANMSHEIRTPVNSIIGFSQLLESEADPANRMMFLGVLKNSSRHLLHLIDDILDLSRIEAGDLKIQYSTFRVDDLLAEVEKEYSYELERRGKENIQIICKTDNRNIFIHSDRIRLKQIIANLVSNSAKFTEAGFIKMAYTVEDSSITFTVSDTGIGISPDLAPRILDPFIKLESNEINHEGTGIGLSIVAKLTKLLGGKLSYESLPCKGASFSITFPDAIRKDQKVNEKKPTVYDSCLPRSLPVDILVVDDDPGSLLLVETVLQPLNLNIHRAKNGAEAINIIRSRIDIRLVIMDIKMPEIDGYKASREIKTINPEVTIIGHSAYAMTGDREKALASGCDDYITKPVDAELLKRTVLKYSGKLFLS